jgi:hypothetical protein
MKEIRLACLVVWLIVSSAGGLLAAAPLLAGASGVYGWMPRCSGCVLCGMTTAFVHISRGEFEEAQQANRASIAVYSAFVTNAVAAAAFALWKGIIWKS